MNQKKYKLFVNGEEKCESVIQPGARLEAMVADGFTHAVGLSLIVTPRSSLIGFG